MDRHRLRLAVGNIYDSCEYFTNEQPRGENVYSLLSLTLQIVALQGNPASFVRATAAGEVFIWRLDPTIVGYTQVGSSLILDVIILCFPLPIISTLHMPTKRKFMVGAIFWLGIL